MQPDLFDTETCYYCDRSAVRWCDSVSYAVGASGLVSLRRIDEALICSRPLCREHAVEQGLVFIDGTDEHGNRWGEVDTRDYCPECARNDHARRLMGAGPATHCAPPKHLTLIQSPATHD